MRIPIFKSLATREAFEDKFNNGATVRELMKIYNCSYYPIYKEIRRGTVGHNGNRPVYSARVAQTAYEDELYCFVAKQLQQ